MKEVLVLVALPSREMEVDVEGVVDVEDKEVLVDVLVSLPVQRLLVPGVGGVAASRGSCSASCSESVRSPEYAREEEGRDAEACRRARRVSEDEGLGRLSGDVSRGDSLR